MLDTLNVRVKRICYVCVNMLKIAKIDGTTNPISVTIHKNYKNDIYQFFHINFDKLGVIYVNHLYLW